MFQDASDAVHPARVVCWPARQVLRLHLVRQKEGDLLGPSPAVDLDPAAAIAPDHRLLPQTDLVGSQLAVGQLQHDAADILVAEEVVTGELEAVQGATCIVKERVATPAGEEPIVTSIRDPRFTTGRDARVLDNGVATLARIRGVGTLCAMHRRRLRAVSCGRELDPIRDIGNRIAVGVDIELIYRLLGERLRSGGSFGVDAHGRMHVHDEDGPARVPRFRKSEQITEVNLRIIVRAGEIGPGVVV